MYIEAMKWTDMLEACLADVATGLWTIKDLADTAGKSHQVLYLACLDMTTFSGLTIYIYTCICTDLYFFIVKPTFSSKKLEILPPSGCPPRVNCISTYLPCGSN